MRAVEPIWDIVEEHLDEAAFLWGRWESSLIAPNYKFDEVAWGVEERLNAHLDALEQYGELAAFRLLRPALEADEPDRVCAAAAALLLAQDGAGLDAVLAALRERPAQRPALVRALCCANRPDLRPRLRGLFSDFDEAVVAAAAEVLLFHHEPLGDAIDVLLASDEPIVRALGLRAVPGEKPSPKLRRAIQAALGEDDLTIVDAGIDAGVLLAPAPAWARTRARATEPNGSRAMLLLALRGDAESRALLLGALRDDERRSAALVALSYVGVPEIVDDCLEWLDEPVFGPLIGEMMSALTGVDLDEVGLACPIGDDEEALEHVPEDDLPRPEPMLAMQWWRQQRPRYSDDERYLAGQPRGLSGLLEALADGPMRRRPGLLLDLQLHVPCGILPRLQPRAPTHRQRAELAELRRLLEGSRSLSPLSGPS